MSSWSGKAPVPRIITTRYNQAAVDSFLLATTHSRFSIALRFKLQSKNAMVLRDGHSTGSSAKKLSQQSGKEVMLTRTRVSSAGSCDKGSDRLWQDLVPTWNSRTAAVE